MKNHPFLSVDTSWEIQRKQNCAYPPAVRCSNGQTMTTFGTTGTNYGTTAAGGHTDEEAMGTLATNNRRLIGAFHN
jgi:hypothetical protein